MTFSYGRGSGEELVNPGRSGAPAAGDGWGGSGDGGSWAVAKLIAQRANKAAGKLRFMMVHTPSREVPTILSAGNRDIVKEAVPTGVPFPGTEGIRWALLQVPLGTNQWQR